MEPYGGVPMTYVKKPSWSAGALFLCALLLSTGSLWAQAGAAPLSSAQIVQIGQWSADDGEGNAARNATLVDVVNNHYAASLAPRQAAVDGQGEKAKEALRYAVALRLFHNAVTEFSNPGAATNTADAVKPGPFYCPSPAVLERIASTYLPELPNRGELGPSDYMKALEAQIGQLPGERYNEFMLDMAGVLQGDRQILEEGGIMSASSLERVAALSEGADAVAEGDEELRTPDAQDAEAGDLPVASDEPVAGPPLGEATSDESAPSVDEDVASLPDEVLREMAAALRDKDDQASRGRLAAIDAELAERKAADDQGRGETIMTAAAPVGEGSDGSVVAEEGRQEGPGLPSWWKQDPEWASSVRRMLNLSQFYVRELAEAKDPKKAATPTVILDPVTGRPLSAEELEAMGAVDEFETGLVNRHDETDSINLGGR